MINQILKLLIIFSQNLNGNAGKILDFQQRKVKLMIFNVFPVLLAAENVLKHLFIHQQLELVNYMGKSKSSRTTTFRPSLYYIYSS